MLADTKSFQEQLTKEMSEWIEKHCDDESVPEVGLSECECCTFQPLWGKKQIIRGGGFLEARKK